MKIIDKIIISFIDLIESFPPNDIYCKFHNISTCEQIYINYHYTEPLIIIKYKKTPDLNNFKSINLCLILEKNNYKIIGSSFHEFNEKKFEMDEKINVNTATIKEDGTQLLLFKYKNKWMCSTTYKFLSDKIDDEMDDNIQQSLDEIIKQPLDEFGEKLYNYYQKIYNHNIIKLEESVTFCFEMCSSKNKIIKNYEKAYLYFLGIFRNKKNEQTHLRPSDISSKFNMIDCLKEINFKNNTTYKQILKKMELMSLADIDFEGIILETNEGKFKIMNPDYEIQHHLKYNGWSSCTPELIVPLILNKKKEILNRTSKCVNDLVFDYEIHERIHEYIYRIEKEYETLLMVIAELVQINYNSKEEYVEILKNNYPNIMLIWDDFLYDIYENIKNINKKDSMYFNNKFVNFIKQNINKIFQNDIFLNNKHSKICCKMTTQTIPENLDEYLNNGMSISKNICYCGEKIIIKQLTQNITRYKFCHCGSAYGYTKYDCFTWLGMCSDPECLCVHEVDPITHKIIGFPASTMCKNLRLNVKELIKLTKSNETNESTKSNETKQIDKTEVENLGISECIELLLELSK